MNLQSSILMAHCAKRTPPTKMAMPVTVSLPKPILEALQQAVTDAVKSNLDDLVTKYFDNRINVVKIMRVVADYFEIEYMHVWSHRRTAVLVRPRQIAMYLCREMTARSLPEIGRLMSGRDHTTVLHAWRKITKLLETDAVLRRQIAELREIICPSSHPDQLRLPLVQEAAE